MSEIVFYDANPTVRDILTRHFGKYGLTVVSIPRLEETEEILKSCRHPVVLVVDLSRQPSMLTYLQSVVPSYIKAEERCILTSIQPTALAPFLPQNVDECFFKHVVERPFKRVEFMNFFDGIVKPYIAASNSIQLEIHDSMMNSSVSQITGAGSSREVEELALREQVDNIVESTSRSISLEQLQVEAEGGADDSLRPVSRMSRRGRAEPRHLASSDSHSGVRSGSVREGSGLTRDASRLPHEGSGLTRDASRLPHEGSGLNRDGSRAPREGSGLTRDASRFPREGSGLNRDGSRSLREGSGLNHAGAPARSDSASQPPSVPDESIENRDALDRLHAVTGMKTEDSLPASKRDKTSSDSRNTDNIYVKDLDNSLISAENLPKPDSAQNNPTAPVLNPYLRRTSAESESMESHAAAGIPAVSSIPAISGSHNKVPGIPLIPELSRSSDSIPGPLRRKLAKQVNEEDNTLIVGALSHNADDKPLSVSPSDAEHAPSVDDSSNAMAHFSFQYQFFLEYLRLSLICEQSLLAICSCERSKLAIFIHAGSVTWIERIQGDHIMSGEEFLNSVQDDCHVPISQLRLFLDQNMTLTQAFSAVDAEPQLVSICEKHIIACAEFFHEFEGGTCTIYDVLPERYRALRDSRPSHDTDIVPALFDELRRNQDLTIAPDFFQKVRFCLRSFRTPLNIHIKLNRMEQDMLTSLQKPQTIVELKRAGKKHASDLLYRLVMFEFVDFVK